MARLSYVVGAISHRSPLCLPRSLNPLGPSSQQRTVLAASAQLPSLTVLTKVAPRYKVEQYDNNPILSFTYLRVKAKVLLDTKELEIYIDQGASRTIVDRKFLKSLDYTIE
jgi:hypothetical protein